AGEDVDLAKQISAEKSRLQFKQAPVTYLVAENRMGDFLAHTSFERCNESFSSAFGQRCRLWCNDKVASMDLSIVDGHDHARVRNQWSERFHHVEGKRRFAVPQLVVKTAVRVEADRAERDSPAAEQ